MEDYLRKKLSKIPPQKRPLRAAIYAARRWVETGGLMYYKVPRDADPQYCKCSRTWGRITNQNDQVMCNSSWVITAPFTLDEKLEYGCPSIAYASLATAKHLHELGMNYYKNVMVDYLNILAFGAVYKGELLFAQYIDNRDLSFLAAWEKHAEKRKK